MGYTDKYTVGVWVGNFDGQSMWDVSGVSGAAPVWRDVMDYLNRGQTSRAPKPPAGLLRQQIAYQPALEAARAEWFIAGTESPVIALVQDQHRAPKILYPGDAAIIALDPDIPDAIQRVFFQAQGGQGLQWKLDGEALGQAATSYSWRPTPGKHQLALVDNDNKPIATASFQVRGGNQLTE
jgi:penicillin-binding protein 1C